MHPELCGGRGLARPWKQAPACNLPHVFHGEVPSQKESVSLTWGRSQALILGRQAQQVHVPRGGQVPLLELLGAGAH